MTRFFQVSFTLVAGLTAASFAAAAPPFSEDFTNGAANWRFNSANSEPLATAHSGGPDGGAYISRTGALPASASQVIFRAHKSFNSSGGAYAGDWLAAGVFQVSAFLRHNAPQPLSFNARFASENNFPGASYFSSAPVPSNAWTQLLFNVTPSSSQLADPTYEGTNYAAIFQGFENSGIGNMQFSVVIPEALRGTGPYTFDLDKVVVSTPEPTGAALAALAVAFAGALASRRRRF